MTAAAVCTTRSSSATAASQDADERGRPRPLAAGHDLRRCRLELAVQRGRDGIVTWSSDPRRGALSDDVTITIVLVAPADARHDHEHRDGRPVATRSSSPTRPTTSRWSPRTIATGIDLTIVKNDERRPASTRSPPRGTQTYTITVDNIGTQDASRHPGPRRAAGRHDLPSARRPTTASPARTTVADGGVVECIGGDDPRHELGELLPPGQRSRTTTPRSSSRSSRCRTSGRCTTRSASIRSTRSRSTTRPTTSTSRTPSSSTATRAPARSTSCPSPRPRSPRTTVATSTVTYTSSSRTTAPTRQSTSKVRDTCRSASAIIEAKDTVPRHAERLPVHARRPECRQLQRRDDPWRLVAHDRRHSCSPRPSPGRLTPTRRRRSDNNIPEGNETNNVGSGPDHRRRRRRASSTSPSRSATSRSSPDASHRLRPRQRTPDRLFSYFIKVTNNGTDPAFNVVVRDVLPAERDLRLGRPTTRP